MKTVLFLCGHNAGRSIMAEAYFNHHNKNPEIKAISAGTHPGDAINLQAIEVLLKNGIDIRNNPAYHNKQLTQEMLDSSVAIYTMGCNVDCSNISGVKEDLGLDDPHGKSEQEVQAIYDMLVERMAPVLAEYN